MLPDYNALLNTMKQAGKNAVEAGDPVKVCFGKVISLSPLNVQVEQKINLGAAQTLLTETIADKLKLNDEVLLLRVQGGQKYIMIDKVV